MAFNDEQKRDIRKYLGVAFGFYDLNSRLESMMNLVGSNDTDQAQIVEWLDRLAEIDEQLTTGSASGTTATYGPLRRVDDVEFHPPDSDGDDASSLGMIDQGRILIARLARAFGVSDYLPSSDYFTRITRSSFVIPLG